MQPMRALLAALCCVPLLAIAARSDAGGNRRGLRHRRRPGALRAPHRGAAAAAPARIGETRRQRADGGALSHRRDNVHRCRRLRQRALVQPVGCRSIRSTPSCSTRRRTMRPASRCCSAGPIAASACRPNRCCRRIGNDWSPRTSAPRTAATKSPCGESPATDCTRSWRGYLAATGSTPACSGETPTRSASSIPSAGQER